MERGGNNSNKKDGFVLLQIAVTKKGSMKVKIIMTVMMTMYLFVTILVSHSIYREGAMQNYVTISAAISALIWYFILVLIVMKSIVWNITAILFR
eukprot:1948110-Ditylum_brightwellii.AAC.1